MASDDIPVWGCGSREGGGVVFLDKMMMLAWLLFRDAVHLNNLNVKTVKVAHTRLPSIGFRS